MIKIYGSPMSTCTRKVLTALSETNLPFELEVIDFAKGEHKAQPHLGRQPFGQIPAIDDGGFKFFESRAICRYLSEKAGGKLTAETLQSRAEMDEWSSVEQSNYSPSAMKFIYHHVFGRAQEATVLEAAEAMVDKVYGALSVPLAKNTFLTGDKFTVADIGFMPYLEYLTNTPLQGTLEKHPHVLAWWGRLRERPSWRKVVAGA